MKAKSIRWAKQITGLIVINGLFWWRVEAQPYSIEKEPIVFTNGPVVLHGTLMKPSPQSNHPALLLIHGSGPATRDTFLFATDLVRAGICVAVYDKRGTGESTGDWTTASLDDLAADALAAVRFLKARADIRRLGLWGGSQGGWIVPLVASQSTNVDFVISVSAAGMNPARQMLYYQENRWRETGLSEKEIHRLQSAWSHFYDYLIDGRGATVLDREVAELEAMKILDDRRPLKSSELSENSFFRRFGYGFNPLPRWEKVRCPVLAIWGEKDTVVPALKSAKLIEQALRSGGHTNYVIKILPNADHGISVPGKMELPNGETKEWEWAPGYIGSMVDWIGHQADKNRRD